MNIISKKYYILGVISIALGINICSAEFVVQDFISPRTGKSTVFWRDASKGKDAYVLEYDEATDHYYFKKVEKNKPSPKKSKTSLTAGKSSKNEIEKQKVEAINAIDTGTKTAVNDKSKS